VGADGDKPSDIDVPERDASESPAGAVVLLPSIFYRHAAIGGRHQQLSYRFICFIGISYHYATSASHDDQRLANHATRSRVGCLHLPQVEEEGADIYFVLHPQR
jgi:hypothetical protein